MSSSKHEHEPKHEHKAVKHDLKKEAAALLEGVPVYRERLVNIGVHVDRIIGYDNVVAKLRDAETDDELEEAIAAYKMATA